jgi:hypothetical protein
VQQLEESHINKHVHTVSKDKIKPITTHELKTLELYRLDLTNLLQVSPITAFY